MYADVTAVLGRLERTLRVKQEEDCYWSTLLLHPCTDYGSKLLLSNFCIQLKCIKTCGDERHYSTPTRFIQFTHTHQLGHITDHKIHLIKCGNVGKPTVCGSFDIVSWWGGNDPYRKKKLDKNSAIWYCFSVNK
jgi:hypothetical protein